MQIGCFALIEPFRDLRRQFEAIREMGFDCADITDNHDGATLGTEFGFAASASLEAHPETIRALAGSITLTAVCAHANLLDPTAADVYGTLQIVKAIKLAHFLGVRQVITTEGEPRTRFGQGLSPDQRRLIIREKLQTPIRWAATLGIELLLEPHGIVTDDVEQLRRLLDELGNEQTVGVNLDTGNSWLGGADPLEYIRVFGPRIRHVHWKDMPADMRSQRGKQHGCGMATIPLGDGVVGIEAIVKALKQSGFNGPTTLEIAGAEALKVSAERLRKWESETGSPNTGTRNPNQ